MNRAKSKKKSVVVDRGTNETIISSKPKEVVNLLLSGLPERSRLVIESRFGLGKTGERQTLESIGRHYGITRERVRQIENHAIALVHKSPSFALAKEIFDELERHIGKLGGVVCEEDLLVFLSKDELMQNYIYFLLVLGDPFKYRKEDDEVQRCWYVDPMLAKNVEDALVSLYSGLSDKDLMTESEMIDRFLKGLKDVNDDFRNAEITRRWLAISKKIAKNPLGEWGLADSPNVKTKGVRDFAYLAVKKHGSPLHFTEVADMISKIFGRSTHVATTHNELIKDERFVLVGRGMYALREWGYAAGVVRDVIKKVLRDNGPMTRENVVDKVLKERHVKPGTVIVNLQNPKYFKKGKDGKWSVVKN